MITYIEKRQNSLPYRILSAIIAFTFISNLVLPPGYAQVVPTILNLPAPGTMVIPAAAFNPAVIAGITIHPENPLQFDFIVNTGDSRLAGQELTKEANKLIKYFLAALTVPEKELWVNLSPYEKDRIIPQGFGTTEMGRDLLAQDYLLKQLTASLMYPEKELGKKFWDKVYKQAREKYGTTEIPVNTFNKVWIVPEDAVIYEQDNSAFVVKSHLKVMLEEDYEAQKQDAGSLMLDTSRKSGIQKPASSIETSIIKEVILPAIEQEVNEGENFANLRQIYNSTILATWYKMTLKESLLDRVYVDRNKTKGIDIEDKQVNEKIYSQYLEAFRKGVYNYIKEDYDEATQEVIPRKYFSGGADLTLTEATNVNAKPAMSRLRRGVNGVLVMLALGGNLAGGISSTNAEDMIASGLKGPGGSSYVRVAANLQEFGPQVKEDDFKKLSEQIAAGAVLNPPVSAQAGDDLGEEWWGVEEGLRQQERHGKIYERLVVLSTAEIIGVMKAEGYPVLGVGADILAERKDASAVKPLIELYHQYLPTQGQKEGPFYARADLVSAIGRIGGDEAKRFLQEAVKNDPSPTVRDVEKQQLLRLSSEPASSPLNANRKSIFAEYFQKINAIYLSRELTRKLTDFAMIRQISESLEDDSVFEGVLDQLVEIAEYMSVYKGGKGLSTPELRALELISLVPLISQKASGESAKIIEALLSLHRLVPSIREDVINKEFYKWIIENEPATEIALDFQLVKSFLEAHGIYFSDDDITMLKREIFGNNPPPSSPMKVFQGTEEEIDSIVSLFGESLLGWKHEHEKMAKSLESFSREGLAVYLEGDFGRVKTWERVVQLKNILWREGYWGSDEESMRVLMTIAKKKAKEEVGEAANALLTQATQLHFFLEGMFAELKALWDKDESTPTPLQTLPTDRWISDENSAKTGRDLTAKLLKAAREPISTWELSGRDTFILGEMLLRESSRVIFRAITEFERKMPAEDISQATGEALIRWLYQRGVLAYMEGSEVKPASSPVSVSEWIEKTLAGGENIEIPAALLAAERQKREYVIGGNWKMAVETEDKAVELIRAIAQKLNDAVTAKGLAPEDLDIVIAVAPSFVHLPAVRRELKRMEGLIALGAQDVSAYDPGAKTSEISAKQLADLGIRYVIIGHSERRRGDVGETSGIVNAKVKKALETGLIPIIAVGETLEEREAGRTFDVLMTQFLESTVDLTAEQMKNVIIAYEPVWAIGTGKTATPQEADKAQRFLRAVALNRYGQAVAGALRIQYGGSMNAANVGSLIQQYNIDGGLIGGASLKPDDFVRIVTASLDHFKTASSPLSAERREMVNKYLQDLSSALRTDERRALSDPGLIGQIDKYTEDDDVFQGILNVLSDVGKAIAARKMMLSDEITVLFPLIFQRSSVNSFAIIQELALLDMAVTATKNYETIKRRLKLYSWVIENESPAEIPGAFGLIKSFVRARNYLSSGDIKTLQQEILANNPPVSPPAADLEKLARRLGVAPKDVDVALEKYARAVREIVERIPVVLTSSKERKAVDLFMVPSSRPMDVIIGLIYKQEYTSKERIDELRGDALKKMVEGSGLGISVDGIGSVADFFRGEKGLERLYGKTVAEDLRGDFRLLRELLETGLPGLTLTYGQIHDKTELRRGIKDAILAASSPIDDDYDKRRREEVAYITNRGRALRGDPDFEKYLTLEEREAKEKEKAASMKIDYEEWKKGKRGASSPVSREEILWNVKSLLAQYSYEKIVMGGILMDAKSVLLYPIFVPKPEDIQETMTLAELYIEADKELGKKLADRFMSPGSFGPVKKYFTPEELNRMVTVRDVVDIVMEKKKNEASVSSPVDIYEIYNEVELPGERISYDSTYYSVRDGDTYILRAMLSLASSPVEQILQEANRKGLDKILFVFDIGGTITGWDKQNVESRGGFQEVSKNLGDLLEHGYYLGASDFPQAAALLNSHGHALAFISTATLEEMLGLMHEKMGIKDLSGVRLIVAKSSKEAYLHHLGAKGYYGIPPGITTSQDLLSYLRERYPGTTILLNALPKEEIVKLPEVLSVLENQPFVSIGDSEGDYKWAASFPRGNGQAAEGITDTTKDVSIAKPINAGIRTLLEKQAALSPMGGEIKELSLSSTPEEIIAVRDLVRAAVMAQKFEGDPDPDAVALAGTLKYEGKQMRFEDGFLVSFRGQPIFKYQAPSGGSPQQSEVHKEIYEVNGKPPIHFAPGIIYLEIAGGAGHLLRMQKGTGNEVFYVKRISSQEFDREKELVSSPVWFKTAVEDTVSEIADEVISWHARMQEMLKGQEKERSIGDDNKKEIHDLFDGTFKEKFSTGTANYVYASLSLFILHDVIQRRLAELSEREDTVGQAAKILYDVRSSSPVYREAIDILNEKIVSAVRISDFKQGAYSRFEPYEEPVKLLVLVGLDRIRVSDITTHQVVIDDEDIRDENSVGVLIRFKDAIENTKRINPGRYYRLNDNTINYLNQKIRELGASSPAGERETKIRDLKFEINRLELLEKELSDKYMQLDKEYLYTFVQATKDLRENALESLIKHREILSKKRDELEKMLSPSSKVISEGIASSPVDKVFLKNRSYAAPEDVNKVMQQIKLLQPRQESVLYDLYQKSLNPAYPLPGQSKETLKNLQFVLYDMVPDYVRNVVLSALKIERNDRENSGLSIVSPVAPTVLVVDNDPSSRELAQLLLSEAEETFEVVTATDSQDALEKLELYGAYRFKAALVDRMGGAGIELIKSLKEKAPQLRVIVKSTLEEEYLPQEELRQLEGLAAAPLLNEGTLPEKLVDTVTQVLASSPVGGMDEGPSNDDRFGHYLNDLKDTRRNVRLAAVIGLGDLGDRRAEEPLIGILKNDPDDGVRLAAAIAFRKMSPRTWPEDFLERLSQEKASVRGQVLQRAIISDTSALGREDAEWLKELGISWTKGKTILEWKTIFLTHPSGIEHTFAVHMLGELLAGEKKEEVLREDIIKTMVVRLEHGEADAGVRLGIVLALGRIGGQEALTALRKAMRDDERDFVREAAKNVYQELMTQGDETSSSPVGVSLSPEDQGLLDNVWKKFEDGHVIGIGERSEEAKRFVESAHREIRRWGAKKSAYDVTYSFGNVPYFLYTPAWEAEEGWVEDGDEASLGAESRFGARTFLTADKKQLFIAMPEDPSDVLGGKKDISLSIHELWRSAVSPLMVQIVFGDEKEDSVKVGIVANVRQQGEQSGTIPASSPAVNQGTGDRVQGTEAASDSFTKGGIDLNPALLDLQIKRDGNGVPLPLPMQPIQDMHIEGFLPIIINITPITNLPMLLGFADTKQDADEIMPGMKAREPEEISALN